MSTDDRLANVLRPLYGQDRDELREIAKRLLAQDGAEWAVGEMLDAAIAELD